MAKGPKDMNQIAFDAVARATGGPTSAELERARKGGEARAESLTAEQRAEIASNAAKVRWNKPAIQS
jgi:hypothetical protein